MAYTLNAPADINPGDILLSMADFNITPRGRAGFTRLEDGSAEFPLHSGEDAVLELLSEWACRGVTATDSSGARVASNGWAFVYSADIGFSMPVVSQRQRREAVAEMKDAGISRLEVRRLPAPDYKLPKFRFMSGRQLEAIYAEAETIGEWLEA